MREFLFLANIDPALQAECAARCRHVKLVGGDTMNLLDQRITAAMNWPRCCNW